MIEKINNLTDYSPELQSYTFQLVDLVNDAYFDIWTQKRWNFATKEKTLVIRPDITATSEPYATSGINANVVAGERKVSFSDIVDRLINTDYYEGAIISIQNQEYTISKVVDLQTILLDRDFVGETVADDSTWIIKKRYLDLPEDCMELLYLGHRDVPYNTFVGSQVPFGKAGGLYPRRDEENNIRVDLTRTYAECYIPSPAAFIQPAEVLGITTAGGGSISGTYNFEFCYAFLKDGKLSALSEPKQVKVTGENQKIRLDFITWDNQAIFCPNIYNSEDKSTPQWEGYKKVIFYNKNYDPTTGERIAKPCWISVTNGTSLGPRNTSAYLAPVVVPDFDFFYDIVNIDQMNSGSKRYIERDGQHERLRLYPRPQLGNIVRDRIGGNDAITQYYDVYSEMSMRYYKKPQNISLVTDVPEMPIEFHKIVVYKALEQIYAKLGQQGLSAKYEKQIMKDIKDLQKRYTDTIDFVSVRGQFSSGTVYSSRFDSQTLRRLNN